MISREATTVWDGDLVHGSGNVSGMSGALDKLPVTFKSRIGSPDGRTSPEELIAAAHSSCFSMALANLLTQEGHPPAQLDVTADVTLDDTSGTPTITAAALKVTGRVDGLDAAALQEAADRARRRVPSVAGARIGKHHRAGDDRVEDGSPGGGLGEMFGEPGVRCGTRRVELPQVIGRRRLACWRQ